MHLPQQKNRRLSGLADITFNWWKFQAVLKSLFFISMHLKEDAKILLLMHPCIPYDIFLNCIITYYFLQLGSPLFQCARQICSAQLRLQKEQRLLLHSWEVLLLKKVQKQTLVALFSSFKVICPVGRMKRLLLVGNSCHMLSKD